MTATFRRIVAALDPAGYSPRIEWALTVVYSLTFAALLWVGLGSALTAGGAR